MRFTPPVDVPSSTMQRVEARQPVTEVLTERPARNSVLIVPGVPNYTPSGAAEALYPPTVIDLVKLVRQAGAPIDFADDRKRAYLVLKANEVWLPILLFVEEALIAGFGVIVGDALRELIGYGEGRRPKLNVKMGKLRNEDETIEWMSADGDADDVLEAIDSFLRRPHE
jgi:hypothetical protein